MNKLNAIEAEYLMKIYSDLITTIQKERELIDKEGVDPTVYDIVDIDVYLNSKKLFELYEKFYHYFSGEYLEFVSSLFKIIDRVEEIEDIKSVTDITVISVYKSIVKKDNLPVTDYERLGRITLLEHITDIVGFIIADIEEGRKGKEDMLTASEGQHLLLLALLHDIGKIMPLMSSYGISKSNGSHETRSRIFIDMILEGYDSSKSLEPPLKRLGANLLKMENNETNGTLLRFHEYDKRARVVELNRLKDPWLL